MTGHAPLLDHPSPHWLEFSNQKTAEVSVIYSSDGAGLQLRTTPLTFEVTSDLAVSATCS